MLTQCRVLHDIVIVILHHSSCVNAACVVWLMMRLGVDSLAAAFSVSLLVLRKQGQSLGLDAGLGCRKEWICSDRPITVCAIVKSCSHARSHRSGISARSCGNKDQSGLSYRLHYRET